MIGKIIKTISNFGITAEKRIGGNNERLDNKADMEILNTHGWKPQQELMKYINTYRRKNV